MAVATVSGRPVNSVAATCTAQSGGRRLEQSDEPSEIQSEQPGRRLQGGTVNLDYTIEVEIQQSQAATVGQNLITTMKAVTPVQLQTAVVEALTQIAPAKAAVTTFTVASVETEARAALVDPTTDSEVGEVNEVGEVAVLPPPPSPTPSPSPSPTSPPSPSPTSRPSPSPSPVPAPVPTPSPAPSPAPVPASSPAPVPAPSPSPTPTATEVESESGSMQSCRVLAMTAIIGYVFLKL
eukprot:TRINITY_DN9533_c0_g1_i3.p1 TRINITY_DN9533_c0_g1~~TRINITY_DN9533_c0_g1_i3.p1  ORF type:complete len:274 (+),score=25.52 TRINITY_DN9533_c0_g1_i3:112-822(+)